MHTCTTTIGPTFVHCCVSEGAHSEVYRNTCHTPQGNVRVFRGDAVRAALVYNHALRAIEMLRNTTAMIDTVTYECYVFNCSRVRHAAMRVRGPEFQIQRALARTIACVSKFDGRAVREARHGAQRLTMFGNALGSGMLCQVAYTVPQRAMILACTDTATAEVARRANADDALFNVFRRRCGLPSIIARNWLLPRTVALARAEVNE